jgi:hypothetical protein
MNHLRHFEHIAFNVSHANCPQCNADNERRLAGNRPHEYKFVSEYLKWIRPRLEAIRAGNDTVDARIWHKDFMRAMHRRISSHLPASGRKFADSYLERLRIANWKGNKQTASYFRTFAARNASALD